MGPPRKVAAHLLKPALSPYELRVHVYQANDLPPADADGQSDPYLVATIAGKRMQTSVRRRTLFPRWYETLKTELDLPSREWILARAAWPPACMPAALHI